MAMNTVAAVLMASQLWVYISGASTIQPTATATSSVSMLPWCSQVRQMTSKAKKLPIARTQVDLRQLFRGVAPVSTIGTTPSTRVGLASGSARSRRPVCGPRV
jgi:hypothetical protein